MLGRRRVRIDVHDVVQGAGYRRFGYRLATELGTSGDACNVGGSVALRTADIDELIANFVAYLHGYGAGRSRRGCGHTGRIDDMLEGEQLTRIC